MSVDRVFLDANILFSVAYGSPGLERLWERAQKGLCELFASRYVVEVAQRNLKYPDQVNKLKSYLANVQIVLEAAPNLSCPIDLPGKDRPVFMAAVFARADYLITGDMIHFGKYFGRTVSGVKICTARDYLHSSRPIHK